MEVWRQGVQVAQAPTSSTGRQVRPRRRMARGKGVRVVRSGVSGGRAGGARVGFVSRRRDGGTRAGSEELRSVLQGAAPWSESCEESRLGMWLLDRLPGQQKSNGAEAEDNCLRVTRTLRLAW
eukprot:2336226-Pleurochrysis_carterae.AAC.1